MKINTNIPSLKVLNSMSKNNTALEKSIERLSSGLKINRAADDAAGLAISRKMQVQIDGLKRASDNADDGISLIQTAEGALNEVHSILQRQRELSVQSANGTLSDADRSAVQSEMEMLNKEVDRIASSIQFNNMNLLDGSIDVKTYSSNKGAATTISTTEGVNAGIYGFSIDELSTKTNGIGAEMFDSVVNDKGNLNMQGIIYINSVEVELTNSMTADEAFQAIRDAAELSDVNVSSTTGTISNGGKLVFEHQIAGERNIEITGDTTVLTLLGLNSIDFDDTTVTSSTITTANLATAIPNSMVGQTMNINGVDITVTADEATVEDLIEKIKIADIPGCEIAKNADGTYSIDSSYFEISDKTDAGTIAAMFGNIYDSSASTTSDTGTALFAGNKGRNVKATITTWDDPNSATTIGFPAGTTVSTKGNKITFTGMNGFELLIENNGELDSDVQMIITEAGALDLQIGANEGQTMAIRIPNMSTEALGIENLNLRTAPTSEEAITLLDEAIAKVSEVRSKLGAFQNRLDYTTNSLESAEVNLTEALSRIQDTDMAEEMASYTQYSILSEASISILAQANQRPQGILQLLQNMQ